MFTPSRLALARKRRGLTLVDLARQVDLTAQSLSNMECGRQEPSAANLRRLTTVLGFPISFFGEPDIDELTAVQVSFRARTKMPARAREAVLSAARLVVEVHSWIDSQFKLPDVDIPTLDRTMAPEVAAEHVRARWNLGNLSPIANMVHLLESRGVTVYSIPPEYADIDAFSFWWRGRPFVILNTMKSAERGRFDAAHELAHLVLHKDNVGTEDVRAMEKEANMFAATLLMPTASINRHCPKNPTTDQIIRLKHQWKVAALALTYRLHEVGQLTDWNYRRSVIELGRMGYKTAEPGGASRETSQLLQKVLNSLRGSRVSFSDLSRKLHLTTDELNGYLFRLALTPVTGSGSSASKRTQSTGLRLVSNDEKTAISK
ncbi:ImmA/IrrE family metallo-endopeptidase [Lentzea sp. NPDC034063]|uniref:helix-turn-helix domain-containing protein n=1 Tax=unclassified Lentzea TaxID=2643253 RepID=UPI0033EF34C2